MKDANFAPLGCFSLIGVVILIFMLSMCIWIAGCFNEGAKVAQEQFGVRTTLKKYEYFKDMAAALDAKLASIKVAESRQKNMEKGYENVARKDWARQDIEQYNLWVNEVSGMKAMYNKLAAEYNSAMSKENYAYANVGELPKGASNPLPREFKVYIEN